MTKRSKRSERKKARTWSQLPRDLVNEIFLLLDCPSQLALHQTCQRFRRQPQWLVEQCKKRIAEIWDAKCEKRGGGPKSSDFIETFAELEKMPDVHPFFWYNVMNIVEKEKCVKKILFDISGTHIRGHRESYRVPLEMMIIKNSGKRSIFGKTRPQKFTGNGILFKKNPDGLFIVRMGECYGWDFKPKRVMVGTQWLPIDMHLNGAMIEIDKEKILIGHWNGKEFDGKYERYMNGVTLKGESHTGSKLSH